MAGKQENIPNTFDAATTNRLPLHINGLRGHSLKMINQNVDLGAFDGNSLPVTAIGRIVGEVARPAGHLYLVKMVAAISHLAVKSYSV